MKRVELVDLYKKIEKLPAKNYNKYLLLSIMKTKILFNPEINKIVDKERELYFDERFNEFEQKRIVIVQSYSEKTEDGTYKIDNGQYVIRPESNNDAQEKIRDLKKEYSEVLSEHDRKISEYNTFINADIDIEIVKTSFENLPTDMTPDEFEFLSRFVKEE